MRHRTAKENEYVSKPCQSEMPACWMALAVAFICFPNTFAQKRFAKKDSKREEERVLNIEFFSTWC